MSKSAHILGLADIGSRRDVLFPTWHPKKAAQTNRLMIFPNMDVLNCHKGVARTVKLTVSTAAGTGSLRGPISAQLRCHRLLLAVCREPQIASAISRITQSIGEVLKHYPGLHPDMARTAIGKLVQWYEGLEG